MKGKKLPIVKKSSRTPVPADAQRANQLAVSPVAAETASKPGFPRRGDLRTSTALLGGAMMLATGGLAHAKAASKTANPGTVDGNPLPKKAPKIKLTREGGGIGPATVMWEAEDVEAFLNWHFAHDGHLDIKTAYSMDLGDGTKVTLDGFDPTLNIGYEFVYGDDSEEFTDAAVAKLKDMMKAKKAAVLVINMSGTPDESTLSKKVSSFLAQVKKNPPTPTGQAVEEVMPPEHEIKGGAC
jgi:hypothetical protein